MEERCHSCDRTIDEVGLRKCPICFKHFCDEHSHHQSGRPFCSKGCAEFFFFGDGDDDERE